MINMIEKIIIFQEKDN